MVAKPNSVYPRRSTYWTWPGPANAYVAAIIAILAYLFTLHFGGSQFAMAIFAAVVLCYCLVDTATRRRHLNKWNSVVAWLLRVFAAVIGYWLFNAENPFVIRMIAIVVYAVVYIVCELAIWRRIREYRQDLMENTIDP